MTSFKGTYLSYDSESQTALIAISKKTQRRLKTEMRLVCANPSIDPFGYGFSRYIRCSLIPNFTKNALMRIGGDFKVGPTNVVQFMANRSIYDPVCHGSGRLAAQQSALILSIMRETLTFQGTPLSELSLHQKRMYAKQGFMNDPRHSEPRPL
jgi:hypothetical protein